MPTLEEEAEERRRRRRKKKKKKKQKEKKKKKKKKKQEEIEEEEEGSPVSTFCQQTGTPWSDSPFFSRLSAFFCFFFFLFLLLLLRLPLLLRLLLLLLLFRLLLLLLLLLFLRLLLLLFAAVHVIARADVLCSSAVMNWPSEGKSYGNMLLFFLPKEKAMEICFYFSFEGKSYGNMLLFPLLPKVSLDSERSLFAGGDCTRGPCGVARCLTSCI
jgi:hypothetical protein